MKYSHTTYRQIFIPVFIAGGRLIQAAEVKCGQAKCLCSVAYDSFAEQLMIVTA